MEEKVYSRSVNKTNLAARVLDQKCPERCFSARELEDIMNVYNWVQCDCCEKWRMLPPTADVEELPEKWFCKMNVDDEPRSVCTAEERGKDFYEKLFYQQKDTDLNQSKDGQSNENVEIKTESATGTKKTKKDDEKLHNTERDEILQKLLTLSETTTSKTSDKITNKSTALISRYYFHESFLKESDKIEL